MCNTFDSFFALLLLVIASTHAETVKICATPSMPGLTSVNAKNEVIQYNGKMATPIKGAAPAILDHGKRMPIFDPPLSGFIAHVLTKVMHNADLKDYTLTMHPSWSELLYRTVITDECDVGFQSFTVTESRSYCRNVTSSTGIAACLPPKLPTDPILAEHGCCAMFGVPFFPETIGVIVPKVVRPGVITAVLSTQVLNIVCLCIVAVVFFAHLVWIFERKENPEQFPPDYLDGIDDAIWWSCTTVTTVGYGDKFPITNIGRLIALVWMFSGVVFLGLFAGAVSSSMAESSRRSEIQNVAELPRLTTNVCTPSTYYGKRYLDQLTLTHYKGDSMTTCLDDLQNGIATAVMYDTKDLRYAYKMDKNLQKDYIIVPGDINEVLAPAFSKKAIEKHWFQAMNSALLELQDSNYDDLLDEYYPKPGKYRTGKYRTDDTETDEPINWLLAGPSVFFISVYWIMCTVSSCMEGEWDSWLQTYCGCCGFKKKTEQRAKKSDETSTDTEAKEQKKEDTSGTEIQLTVVSGLTETISSSSKAQRRKKSYMGRDIDLHENEKHQHGHGHNRTLFLDSPEFIGLQKETHSVHRLLCEQAESIETLLARLEQKHQNEEAVETFATVDTSDEEDPEGTVKMF